MTESELVKKALSQPWEVKFRQSVQLLQMYETFALRINPDGYYLAFSGGKDSICMKRVADIAGVKYKAYYHNTTVDPPEVCRFIRDIHPDVTWTHQPKHLCKMVEERGLPNRRHRWCCAVYKEGGGDGEGKLIGVRAAESHRRASLWHTFKMDGRGGFFVCPILYWTDKEVWSFIKTEELKYPSVYDEGRTRVGCIGCPLSQTQREELERYPRYAALWRRGAERFYKRTTEYVKSDGDFYATVNFPTFEHYWAWWLAEGKRWQRGSKEACMIANMLAGWRGELAPPDGQMPPPHGGWAKPYEGGRPPRRKSPPLGGTGGGR